MGLSNIWGAVPFFLGMLEVVLELIKKDELIQKRNGKS